MNTKRNNFAPSIERLEDRCLLSVSPLLTLPRTSPVNIQVVSTLAPPLTLPRTGGVAIQVGSTLELGVAPAGSALPATPFLGFTKIVEDGLGDVAVSWDGGPVHNFSGITSISFAGDAPVNEVLLISTEPLQSAEQISLHMTGVVNTFVVLVPPGGAPLTAQVNPGVFTLVI